MDLWNKDNDLDINLAIKEKDMDLDRKEKEKEKEKEKKRCRECKRKLVISDMECGKCKNRYCASHRQPECHCCPCLTTAIQDGKKLLEKQNPRIVADKMISRI